MGAGGEEPPLEGAARWAATVLPPAPRTRCCARGSERGGLRGAGRNRAGGWVGGSRGGFPSRLSPPHPGEHPLLGRNRANPGAVRCPAPAPRAEPRWPLLRHGLPRGAEPRAQSGGGGASSEPAPPGHGERRRRARGLGLRLGLGHGAAQPPPGDREAAGGHRGPGGPPGLQVLHGRVGRRGGAQRARALLQVGVGRAPGGGPAVAVPAQPGQSLLHRHQHGGSRPGPPAGLPGARHLLLLLPRLAHQRGGPRLLHHGECGPDGRHRAAALSAVLRRLGAGSGRAGLGARGSEIGSWGSGLGSRGLELECRGSELASWGSQLGRVVLLLPYLDWGSLGQLTEEWSGAARAVGFGI